MTLKTQIRGARAPVRHLDRPSKLIKYQMSTVKQLCPSVLNVVGICLLKFAAMLQNENWDLPIKVVV